MTARVVAVTTDQTTEPIATDVHIATTAVEKIRGLMGRSKLPDDYALVFELDSGILTRQSQTVHTFFVRTAIDVVWTLDNEVTRVSTLNPWHDIASADADRVIEFPAGSAAKVSVGDQVQLVEKEQI